jgi:uncharacterized protein (TIGR00730 family)
VPDAFGSPPRVLFVEQRTARVAIITGGTVFTVGTGARRRERRLERGLLGVAVDPNFPSRPYLYVHCTDGRSGHTIAISRFTLTGDLTHAGNGALQFDPASRYDLLNALSDNATNHNGGTVRFGPDHMLYVSLGDDMTGCLAQDPAQLVGKILRLDVSRLPAGPGGPPPLALLIPPGNPFPSLPDSNSKLVWTVGLRNPFRFHIDDRTGALEIADVGQDTYEELDLAPSSGMDMGWPLKEASSLYASCSQQPPSPITSPIHYYDHSVGLAIMSAGVYRERSTGNYRFGTEYDGDCFLIDYYSGMMRRLKGSGSSWSIAPMVQGQTSSSWATGLDQVSDVLETADGALWYCRQTVSGAAGTGEIRRIGPRADDECADRGRDVLDRDSAPEPERRSRHAGLDAGGRPARRARRLRRARAARARALRQFPWLQLAGTRRCGMVATTRAPPSTPGSTSCDSAPARPSAAPGSRWYADRVARSRNRSPLAYRDDSFMDSSEGRPVRILAEYLQPLRSFRREGVRDTIVFFGSARIDPRGPLREYYAAARELARLVTRWSAQRAKGARRYMVCSGGGPGIMEAANRGASDAGGRSIGLNIGLPHEQAPNPYISQGLSFEFRYFFMRKLWFSYLARAFIAFPGGFGTLDELFEIITLCQTHKLDRPVTVLLYGTPVLA